MSLMGVGAVILDGWGSLLSVLHRSKAKFETNNINWCNDFTQK